jgi:hypothetical protein
MHGVGVSGHIFVPGVKVNHSTNSTSGCDYTPSPSINQEPAHSHRFLSGIISNGWL